MATAESESENLNRGYDTDNEGNAEHEAQGRTHSLGKKSRRKRDDSSSSLHSHRHRFRRHDRGRARGACAASDRSPVQSTTNLYSNYSWSSSSESDLDPGAGCSRGHELAVEDQASCSKTKDQATSRPEEYQGSSNVSSIVAKHSNSNSKGFNNNLVPLSRNRRTSETKRMKEGAVTFRPIKKHHRQRHKRPKMKSLDQEKMAAFKKSHQHSTPSDLSLYARTNGLFDNGIPVNMNFNISALIHPPYISIGTVVPMKKRKKMSVSSDSEAISDNEVLDDPVQVTERRTCSSSESEEVYTIPDSSPDDDGRESRTKDSPKGRSSDSDVICLGFDSDHKSASLCKSRQPINVDTLSNLSHHHAGHSNNSDLEFDHDKAFVDEPPKPIIVESPSDFSDHYNGHDDDGANSDSSDLPECPILEEMSKVTPCRTMSVSSYSEQPLFQNDAENFETIERKYVKREAQHVPSLERGPPLSPTSPPDCDRSRHSSGDLDERIEQPTDACWVAFLLASGDTKASDLSVRNYQHNQHISKAFRQDKGNAVLACHEEEFTQAAVNLLSKFTTTAHKPPPQLLQQLFHDTLREYSKSYAEASVVYTCLKNIQHLHHPSSRDLPIDWNLIKSIASSLVSAPSREDLNNNESPSIKWHIDLLSLHFLVSVLEDDVERKARWDTLKKSFAFSILNPENCRNNCREVVEWIHKLVSDLEPSQGIEASTTSSNICGANSCGCPDSACHRNYVLPLLGKLLELSFRMTNAWTLKTYLQRTVEELNSCGLRGLPQLRLLFETLQQPWLRLKLSDLIFNSHFESKIFSISRENVSVSRIVQEYFFYLPRPTSVNHDEEVEEEVVMKTRFSRSSREQMVYLLLVMLQSYLKCYCGSLSKEEQGKKSTSPSKSSSLWSSLCRKQLPDDDRICLLQMGDYVDQLRNHLSSSSHPDEWSVVTEVCLAQMSVLYEWM